MGRVILIGADPSIANLHRIMARAGVEVEVHAQLDDGIIGNSASLIMVDECLAKMESNTLYYSNPTSGAHTGLLALAFDEGPEYAEKPWAAPSVYGNPRPYLKRKKGRS
jgi:hypothetical protein